MGSSWGALKAVELPSKGEYTTEWVLEFSQTLVKASWQGANALPKVLSADDIVRMLETLYALLAERPPLIEVRGLPILSCSYASFSQAAVLNQLSHPKESV